MMVALTAFKLERERWETTGKGGKERAAERESESLFAGPVLSPLLINGSATPKSRHAVACENKICESLVPVSAWQPSAKDPS
jgi:hypothetical protein